MDNHQNNRSSDKRRRAYSKIDLSAQKRSAPKPDGNALQKRNAPKPDANAMQKRNAPKPDGNAAQNRQRIREKDAKPQKAVPADRVEFRNPQNPVVKRRGRPAKKGGARQPVVSITPLGGIEEIGKNMTLFACDGDMIIVDCGMGFPDDELYGIDIVIPDFTYAVENQEHIRALLITHGHEDHIGAIPYFLKQVKLPVYGTKLTIGLIEAKLKEHGMTADLHVIEPGDELVFGRFRVEPVRVNHSIPGAVAFAIDTPAGMIVHTGDFKVDYTPIVDDVIDLRRFGELGSKGVRLLMSDSTNAERFGASVSERIVGEGFEKLFARADGKRVVIATFASNVQRVQQIIDLAVRRNRRVVISGRSMENYSEMAGKLGYLTIPDGILIDLAEVNRYRPEDVIIVTTGSQGEPMSALSRMANGTHKQIGITANDLVIISATPVPGNEKTVTKVINELLKLGSDVVYESMYEVHASGHACREDLKLMLNLLKPQFFIPVHGEYKHLVRHRELAMMMGIEPQNVLIPAIGQTMELGDGLRYGETVVSGRVLVDGSGVGDVGSIVLRDRKHLSQDGLMAVVCSVDANTNELVSGPDIISRGFVFVRESEALFEEARAMVREIVTGFSGGRNKRKDRADVKIEIKESLAKLMYQRTRRNPMILPIIMEI